MVRKLGKYIVGPTLGEGGYSKVKLGTHEVTGEKVALKLLPRNKYSNNSSEKRQVEREVDAMKAIQHRNVIQLKFVDWDAVYEKRDGTTQDIILVVLELATGGELFEFLSFTGSFEEKIARSYFHQLMEGLSYCHSRGVVHRDLKPENLLMDDNFLLKLADFGFSRIFNPEGDGSDKIVQTECGTTGYMAPEMFKGYDKRRQGYDATLSDVWACGVILFIMLAGFPPFQKPSPSDWWFDKLQSRKLKQFWQAHCRSAAFSEPAKDLIAQILHPDPEKRLTVQGVMEHPWYKGPTIAESVLTKAFGERKKIVDSENAKIKMQKQQELESGQLGGQMVRDLGDTAQYDDDNPPPAIPSMDLFVKPGEESGGKPSFGDGRGSGSVPGGEFGFDDESSSSFFGMKKKQAEPLLYDDTISVCTHFISKRPADEVWARLQQALGVLKAEVAVHEQDFRIKAIVNTPTGPLSFTVQVFKQSVESEALLVELKRRKGDSAEFRNIFAAVRLLCDDIAQA